MKPIERYTMIHNIAKIHSVKLHLECEDEPKNHASSAGNEIFMGLFDDADILTIAFFHELAHCLSDKVLPHRKYYSSILADEGFAWEYGFELASAFGCTWDIKHKVYQYAEENLRSYIHTENTNQTNEEWFCGLPTEEKAEVFGSMLFEAWKDGLAEEMHNKRFYEDLVDFWLKQPHNKEE